MSCIDFVLSDKQGRHSKYTGTAGALDKKMKTQADGDFHNGLPEVDPDHCQRLQSVLASITRNSDSFSVVRHDKASDSLCKCRLRLGSSDKYKRIVKG